MCVKESTPSAEGNAVAHARTHTHTRAHARTRSHLCGLGRDHRAAQPRPSKSHRRLNAETQRSPVPAAPTVAQCRRPPQRWPSAGAPPQRRLTAAQCRLANGDGCIALLQNACDRVIEQSLGIVRCLVVDSQHKVRPVREWRSLSARVYRVATRVASATHRKPPLRLPRICIPSQAELVRLGVVRALLHIAADGLPANADKALATLAGE